MPSNSSTPKPLDTDLAASTSHSSASATNEHGGFYASTVFRIAPLSLSPLLLLAVCAFVVERAFIQSVSFAFPHLMLSVGHQYIEISSTLLRNLGAICFLVLFATAMRQTASGLSGASLARRVAQLILGGIFFLSVVITLLTPVQWLFYFEARFLRVVLLASAMLIWSVALTALLRRSNRVLLATATLCLLWTITTGVILFSSSLALLRPGGPLGQFTGSATRLSGFLFLALLIVPAFWLFRSLHSWMRYAVVPAIALLCFSIMYLLYGQLQEAWLDVFYLNFRIATESTWLGWMAGSSICIVLAIGLTGMWLRDRPDVRLLSAAVLLWVCAGAVPASIARMCAAVLAVLCLVEVAMLVTHRDELRESEH